MVLEKGGKTLGRHLNEMKGEFYNVKKNIYICIYNMIKVLIA
jgi:hypothetical protein